MPQEGREGIPAVLVGADLVGYCCCPLGNLVEVPPLRGFLLIPLSPCGMALALLQPFWSVYRSTRIGACSTSVVLLGDTSDGHAIPTGRALLHSALPDCSTGRELLCLKYVSVTFAVCP